jgi:hypothetical protein
MIRPVHHRVHDPHETTRLDSGRIQSMAVPIPTRRASEGIGCASGACRGLRPSLARRVSVSLGHTYHAFDASVSRGSIHATRTAFLITHSRAVFARVRPGRQDAVLLVDSNRLVAAIPAVRIFQLVPLGFELASHLRGDP